MLNTINKIGFWSALLAFTATVTFSIVQLMQLYGMLQFPADERLIYGSSLLIVVPFVVAMLALHYTVANEVRFWTHLAVIFTTIYAVFVSANYVVQLATVIPMALDGKIDEVRLLQQTPHSMFWDYDAIGYICMGLATLSAAPVFSRLGFQKWVKLSFLANALVTPLIAIVYFYGEYSYELLVLGFPWAITAPLSMMMLALYFNAKGKGLTSGVWHLA